jgi:hypothetical protein
LLNDHAHFVIYRRASGCIAAEAKSVGMLACL